MHTTDPDPLQRLVLYLAVAYYASGTIEHFMAILPRLATHLSPVVVTI